MGTEERSSVEERDSARAGKGGRRGARAATGVLLGLAGFLAIVLVFGLFFGAPLIPRYGLPAASGMLAKSGFSLKAAWVSDRPVSGVTFGDFRIIHTGADGEPVTVFQADTLAVEYKFHRLLRKQWRIESVRLSNAKILLIKSQDGGVLLPGLKGPGKSGRRGGGPTIDIRKIKLTGAVLTISTKTGDEVFERMDLTCSYLRDPWSTRIGLKRAAFIMPGRSLNVVSTSADLTLKQGVLFMDDGFVQLPSSAITFAGNISFKGKTRYDIDCEGRPYNAPELAAIIKQKWPEGVLEGRAGVYGPADSLAIAALVDGKVDRYVLGGLDVECLLGQSGFSFSKVKGLVNGARVDATGTVGGGRLDFDVGFSDLDAAAGFFPGVPFPPTDLAGFAEVFHPSLEAPWEVAAAMTAGQVAGFDFSSLFFKGSVVPGTVTVDSVRIARPEMSAVGAGVIGLGPSGEISLEFKTSIDSLDYVARWLGAGELHGSLTASGRLSGLSSDPLLEAAGPVGWIGRGPARLRGGSFEATVLGLADRLPVEFSLNGGELSLGAVAAGHLALQGTYDKDELRVPAFRLERGDSSAAGSFVLRGRSGGVEAEFDRLDLTLNGQEWKSAQPFIFSYEAGAYSIQGSRITSGDGVLALSGRLDHRREEVDLNVAATGIKMSSLRLPSGEMRGGTASGEVSLRGPLSHPQGSASINWVGARAFDSDVREMTLKCDIDEQGLSVDRLWIDSSVGSCLITGRADIRPDLSEILAGRTRELARSAAGSELDLTVSITDLDLGWFGRTASIESELQGLVSVSGSVSGSLEQPALDLAVQADRLSAEGFSVDHVSGAFEYARGALRLSGVEVTKGDVTALVDGYLPVSIGLGTGVELLSNDPMALEVKVEPDDFGVAAEVWDGLARSSGTFAVDAGVTGTPSSPSLSGSGWLEGCAIRLSGMEEEYQDIRCRFTLKGDRVEVTEVSGRQGKNGSFAGSGVVTLGWPGVVDYNFNFSLAQMAVLTPSDFDAIVSGEVTVTSYPLDGGKLIPRITGRAVVDEASYIGRIGGSELGTTAVAGGTVTPRWLANLELEIPSSATVSNPDADLLLGGDIILIKDFDGLKPRGELTVVSGEYYLVNTKFIVTSGTISFGEAVGVNPDLDITAETVLGTGEAGLEEKVYVHLTGTAREPMIRVTSTSGYSETDIYSMLLAGTLWGQGPQEEGGPDISGLATNTLFNAIDARLRDLFGGRPPVTIDLTREQNRGEVLGGAETRISVGRNLSRRFFLRYEQGFSAITSREVNLDYRVNRYLLLRSQIINNPDRGIREESSSEINFDLKLRYEF